MAESEEELKSLLMKMKGEYRGPALVGSRDSLRRMELAIKRIDKRRKRQGKNFAVKKIKERKEADIPWFTQKANKAPVQALLCSRRSQAPSQIAEDAPP